MTIDLALGSQRLSLDPALGGALLRWRLGDQDLLRQTPTGSRDILETAGFARAPYAHRTAGGRFTFGGRHADLSPNTRDQKLPLRGDVGVAVWTVESVSDACAELVLAPSDPAWPWRYAARQSVRLERGGLVMTLAVTNRDDVAGPFGLGFHPWFPRAEAARLTADVTGALLADWPAGAPVRSAGPIDHCHAGWKGAARIDLGPDRPSLAMTASEALGHLHIHAPQDGDFFCVAPVSHAPDALSLDDPQAHGVRVLGPGETLAAEVRLQVI